MGKVNLADPIRLGEFQFDGDDLYVQAGNGKHLPRAGLVRIREVLKGANNGPNDGNIHWYTAQLIHYGLKPSNVKATAKKRLQDTLDAGDTANSLLKKQAAKEQEDVKKDKALKAAQKAAQKAAEKALEAQKALEKHLNAKSKESKPVKKTPAPAPKKPAVKKTPETTTAPKDQPKAKAPRAKPGQNCAKCSKQRKRCEMTVHGCVSCLKAGIDCVPNIRGVPQDAAGDVIMADVEDQQQSPPPYEEYETGQTWHARAYSPPRYIGRAKQTARKSTGGSVPSIVLGIKRTRDDDGGPGGKKAKASKW
ncbi:hypothetical protein YB2330_004862 [Saitoella coloradoensis]